MSCEAEEVKGTIFSAAWFKDDLNIDPLMTVNTVRRTHVRVTSHVTWSRDQSRDVIGHVGAIFTHFPY